MKLLLFITAFFAMSFANEAFAKKIQIDITVTDSNGKTWVIKGWIEVDMCCPPSLEHWDVWVTDGDGNKHHFTGMAYQGGNGGNGGQSGNGNTGYQMHVYDENGVEEPLDVIPWGIIVVEMENIAANTPPND